MPFSKGFDFDEGSLGRNLATFDQKVEGFIDRDIEVHTTQGELTMKAKAPWRDHTGEARRSLWADHMKSGNTRRIEMGHGVEYGVYLEESNNGRFQIVMPVLVATARSFMQSLEAMFAQLETHATITPFISPGVGTRPGTSQGARERATGAETRPSLPRSASSDRRSSLSSKASAVAKKIFGGITKRTKRTRRG
jgi:hypothetical protein